jgi:hypothetical protein
MAGIDLKPRSGTYRQPRRAVILALAAGGLVMIAGTSSRLVRSAPSRQTDATPGAVASPEATPAPFTAQVFAGEGFVGEAEHVAAGEAFVALVVAEAKPGAEAREVRAIIYGDTQNEIQEWFPGVATADHLDLVSENGAQLRGQFTAEGASGTITLADGTALTFEAVPTTGVAGLYTVMLLPDGRLEGTSERGARLEGQLLAEPEEEGIYPLIGTITPPDGPPQEFEVHFFFVPRGETINARFVVLPDGRMKGGARRRDDDKFTCPLLI